MFITIEGVEGAGKSTAIEFIEEFLRQNKIDFVLSREPGGTEIAEKIRELLLDHHDEKMVPDTELLLMFASRAQHIANLIKPALEEGKLVLCDRFTDASYAYQGRGRNIPEHRIAALENWVQGALRPDLTIILDVSPEVGLHRVNVHNNNNLDRIESEEIDFFNRVRGFYLEQVERYPDRYKLVNAEMSLDKVKKEIISLCMKYILGSSSSGKI